MAEHDVPPETRGVSSEAGESSSNEEALGPLMFNGGNFTAKDCHIGFVVVGANQLPLWQQPSQPAIAGPGAGPGPGTGPGPGPGPGPGQGPPKRPYKRREPEVPQHAESKPAKQAKGQDAAAEATGDKGNETAVESFNTEVRVTECFQVQVKEATDKKTADGGGSGGSRG